MDSLVAWKSRPAAGPLYLEVSVGWLDLGPAIAIQHRNPQCDSETEEPVSPPVWF